MTARAARIPTDHVLTVLDADDGPLVVQVRTREATFEFTHAVGPRDETAQRPLLRWVTGFGHRCDTDHPTLACGAQLAAVPLDGVPSVRED